jgi:glycosyltransferase involved in cell wall biosynthesis
MLVRQPDFPLVTIGLPVYNSAKYLSRSIESLLAQTFRDFVLVISDNASTDGTSEICERYAREDSRVRYHRNPVNIGLSANFNRVFELNQSKYFKWSTSDDFWAPDMLADAVEILEADADVVLCYPKTVIVDGDGREQDRYEDKLHLMQDDPVERFVAVLDHCKLVNHHLGLLRADAIQRTRLFAAHVPADTAFIAEMSLYGKFYEVKKFQFFRRFHSDSSSWNRSSEEQQARRYHAANRRRIAFNNWLYHRTLCSAVLRSPLKPRKKLRLLWRLVKGMYWDRKWLLDDLRRDIPMVLGIAGGNSKQQK